QEQPRTHHPETASDWNELVRLDAQPAWRSGKQGIGAESLFQQESLVENEPIRQQGRPSRVQLVNDGVDILEGGENVHLPAGKGSAGSSQSKQGLVPHRR